MNSISKLVLGLLVGSIPGVSNAQYTSPLQTRSPLWTMIAWSTEQVPVPFLYTFEAQASIDRYPLGNGRLRVLNIDQLARINNGRRFGNPLGLEISISCEVISNGQVVRRVFPQRAGSYILNQHHVYAGGVNTTLFDVYRPTFRFRVVTLARNGFGGSQRTWSFTPSVP